MAVHLSRFNMGIQSILIFISLSSGCFILVESQRCPDFSQDVPQPWGTVDLANCGAAVCTTNGYCYRLFRNVCCLKSYNEQQRIIENNEKHLVTDMHYCVPQTAFDFNIPHGAPSLAYATAHASSYAISHQSPYVMAQQSHLDPFNPYHYYNPANYYLEQRYGPGEGYISKWHHNTNIWGYATPSSTINCAEGSTSTTARPLPCVSSSVTDPITETVATNFPQTSTIISKTPSNTLATEDPVSRSTSIVTTTTLEISSTTQPSTYPTTTPEIISTTESSTVPTTTPEISSTTESSTVPTTTPEISSTTESSTVTTTSPEISYTTESSTVPTTTPEISSTTESSTVTTTSPEISSTTESSTAATTTPEISSTTESSTAATTTPLISSTTQSSTVTTTTPEISSTTTPEISSTTESSTVTATSLSISSTTKPSRVSTKFPTRRPTSSKITRATTALPRPKFTTKSTKTTRSKTRAPIRASTTPVTRTTDCGCVTRSFGKSSRFTDPRLLILLDRKSKLHTGIETTISNETNTATTNIDSTETSSPTESGTTESTESESTESTEFFSPTTTTESTEFFSPTTTTESTMASNAIHFNPLISLNFTISNGNPLSLVLASPTTHPNTGSKLCQSLTTLDLVIKGVPDPIRLTGCLFDSTHRPNDIPLTSVATLNANTTQAAPPISPIYRPYGYAYGYGYGSGFAPAAPTVYVPHGWNPYYRS